MRKNITAPQLNHALDQLQDFLELLPEFGKELFVTDDTIWVSMDSRGTGMYADNKTSWKKQYYSKIRKPYHQGYPDAECC